MTAKKKRLTTVVALAAGICIFSGAAFASYNTSNGYSAYKKGIINTLGATNYTLNVKANLYVDGERVEEFSSEGNEKCALDSDVQLHRKTEEHEYTTETYIQDGHQIYIDSKGEAYIYDNREIDALSYRAMGGYDPEDPTCQKVVRFAELLADTLTGDIKNNFVYLSGDENTDKYEMKLSSIQIPELFNAGVSMVFGSNAEYGDDEYDPTDPYTVLGGDPVIENVSCEFEVDKKGRLTYNLLSIEGSGVGVDNNRHTAKLEYEISVSDYGTTSVDRVDINSLDVEYLASRDEDKVDTEDIDDDIEYIDTERKVAVTDDGKEIAIAVNPDGSISYLD